MKLQRQLHSPQLDHWIIIPIWLCLFLPRFSLASGIVARWRAYSYYTFLFFPGLSCGSPCLWNSQWNQICMSTSVLLEERRRIIFFPLRHCVISQWFFSILTLSYQFKVYSLQRAVDSINNDTTGSAWLAGGREAWARGMARALTGADSLIHCPWPGWTNLNDLVESMRFIIRYEVWSMRGKCFQNLGLDNWIYW